MSILTKSGLIVAAIILSVLCSILLTLYGEQYTRVLGLREWVPLLLLAVIIVFPFAFTFYRNSFEIFEPIYFTHVIFALYFCFVPLVLVYGRGYIMDGIDYRRYLATTLWVVVCALIAIDIGYYLGKRLIRFEFASAGDGRPSGTLFNYAFIGFGITLLLFFGWFATNGIPLWTLNVFDSRASYGEQWDYANFRFGYLSASYRMLLPLLIFMYANRTNYLHTLLVIVLGIITVGLYTGPGGRASTISVVIAFGVYGFLRSNRRPKWWHMLLVAAMIFFFNGFVGENRLARTTEIVFVDAENSWDQFLVGNSMIIAQSMLVKVFPDLHPYLWGQATLELFTFPIPRALWAGKPVNAVYETITHFVPERRTPPLFGQFFADFGFLGVFLSMAIVGMVNAYMFRIWRQNETSEFSRVALALTLSWLLVLYTRNPIQGLTWFGFTFAPIYALQLITRRPGARGRHGFATKSVRFNEATP